MKPIMKKSTNLQYAQDLRPWNLEPHYCRHIGAMTSEDLYDKADIAIQLAYRDKIIETLSDIIHRSLASGQMEKLETAKSVISAFNDRVAPGIWPTKS